MSVVVIGESQDLNGTNFTQMVGRTGRRSFGGKGNVIFYGVSEETINQMKNSKILSINKSNPFDIPILLNLKKYSEFDQRERNLLNLREEKGIVETICENPVFFKSKETKLLTYYQSAQDFSKNLSLLQNDNNLSFLFSHLFQTRYSALIFITLHSEGYFKEICSDSSSNEKIVKNLLLNLAMIFKKSVISEENVLTTPRLPEYPEKLRNMIEKLKHLISTNYNFCYFPRSLDINTPCSDFLVSFFEGTEEKVLKSQCNIEGLFPKLKEFYDILFSLKTFFLSSFLHKNPQFKLPEYYQYSPKLLIVNKIASNLKYYTQPKLPILVKKEDPVTYYFCLVCDIYLDRYLEYLKN